MQIFPWNIMQTGMQVFPFKKHTQVTVNGESPFSHK